MNQTQSLFIAIWCVALCISQPVFSLSPKELLLQSSTYFDKGQYKKALDQISSLDIRADFDSSDDMKLAFKIRAIAYDQTGEKAKASETIRELFFLDPGYQFNPFDTPKSVVALAEQEKAAIDKKNLHLASIKSESQHESEREGGASQEGSPNQERVVIVEKRPSRLTTLFPAGINHFYLESPVKGGVYLSLQTLGLAANVAAFWWKQSYLTGLGKTRLKEAGAKSGFETAQTIQYIGLSTLLVSYIVSVIDALINFHNIPSQKVRLDEITS